MKPSWQLQSSSLPTHIQRWQRMSIAHFHSRQPPLPLLVTDCAGVKSPTLQWLSIILSLKNSRISLPLPHITNGASSRHSTPSRTALQFPDQTNHDRHTRKHQDLIANPQTSNDIQSGSLGCWELILLYKTINLPYRQLSSMAHTHVSCNKQKDFLSLFFSY